MIALTFPLVLTLCATKQGSKSFRIQVVLGNHSRDLITVTHRLLLFPIIVQSVSSFRSCCLPCIGGNDFKLDTDILYPYVQNSFAQSIVKSGYIVNLDNLLNTFKTIPAIKTVGDSAEVPYGLDTVVIF